MMFSLASLSSRNPTYCPRAIRSSCLSLAFYFSILIVIQARPIVRNIRSAHEFDRLLEKHASETGLPVVVDYYSDSCGPCRMMAPIFKKVAADYVDKAVFVKVDTNAQYELSSRYQIRSLPTFHWFVDGQKFDQAVGGIGEGPLRQQTDKAIRGAELDNVLLTIESLLEYYKAHDASKSEAEITSVHQKCVDIIMKNTKQKNNKVCVGDAANKLARRLKQKYGKQPKLVPRFTTESRKSSSANDADSNTDDHSKSSSSKKKQSGSTSSSNNNKPNLHLASLDDLKAELEKRMDEEREKQVENEESDEEEDDPDFHKVWVKSNFPERMVIVGAGPAGLAAAIYGARAGLSPLVIAPSMGGQLQGKGVDVENYPGLNTTGPTVVALMRRQAAHFGAVFEDDVVIQVRVPSSSDSSKLPIQIVTNNTGTIDTHTLIVATGADSNWLGVKGEWELRGGGVSSCATCDGFLYSGKHVVVVGGGDTAMEDALVLARTSQTVTIVHRRDKFRASKILSDRILNYHDPQKINVMWNTTVKEILGKHAENAETKEQGSNDSDTVDLDNIEMTVSGVVLEDVNTGLTKTIPCDAVFVAIGHKPNTQFLNGVVEFDPGHPGYILTIPQGSTQTSVPGIFAAGDVADATYRQAITSAGSGAAAALDAERYLSEYGLGNEAALFEAELLAELQASSDSNDSDTDDLYNVYAEESTRIKGMKESVVHSRMSTGSSDEL